MRTYAHIAQRDDYTSEIGTVYEEKAVGLNEKETTLAYIAFKFDSQFPIDNFKTHVISHLILQNQWFSDDVSETPQVDIHELSLEDCCTLHFFDEEFGKKFIICSRNTRQDAAYNAHNCTFVYQHLMKEILESYGIHASDIDTSKEHFDSLLE